MAMRKSINLLLVIFSLFCASAFAQNAQKTAAYIEGENLTYEAKYNKAVLRGVAAADLNFAVERAPNNQDFLIKSEARSKGMLVELFFKFFQSFQSTVDGETFFIKRTVKRDEQGDRIRDSEALFDYKEKKVIYIETNPNDLTRPPRQIASPIEANTQDLITGIYSIRQLPLAVGRTFQLNVSDSGLVYKVPLRVVAREQQKSILGRVWCFRVEPDIFGANRLIDQKGSMAIWITDDARRLPVRAQINANIGRLEVKLRKIESRK